MSDTASSPRIKLLIHAMAKYSGMVIRLHGPILGLADVQRDTLMQLEEKRLSEFSDLLNEVFAP